MTCFLGLYLYLFCCNNHISKIFYKKPFNKSKIIRHRFGHKKTSFHSFGSFRNITSSGKMESNQSTWHSCSRECFSSMRILSDASSSALPRFSLSLMSWATFFSRSFFLWVTKSISSLRISRCVTWSWTVTLLSLTWSRNWVIRSLSSASRAAEFWSSEVSLWFCSVSWLTKCERSLKKWPKLEFYFKKAHKVGQTFRRAWSWCRCHWVCSSRCQYQIGAPRCVARIRPPWCVIVGGDGVFLAPATEKLTKCWN